MLKYIERFLGFYDAHDVSAESLFSIIKGALIISHGLNVNYCVAQCYDGAAVMSGE